MKAEDALLCPSAVLRFLILIFLLGTIFAARALHCPRTTLLRKLARRFAQWAPHSSFDGRSGSAAVKIRCFIRSPCAARPADTSSPATQCHRSGECETWSAS